LTPQVVLRPELRVALGLTVLKLRDGPRKPIPPDPHVNGACETSRKLPRTVHHLAV